MPESTAGTKQSERYGGMKVHHAQVRSKPRANIAAKCARVSSRLSELELL